MKVSVIIVNYNGREFIGKCIDSVLISSFLDFEVIVVDNASSDDSYQFLQQKYGKRKKVKIFRSDEQLYFTGGSNLGAKTAKGDLLFFLNSDTILEKKSIKELVCFIGNQKKYLVQPKILWHHRKNIIDNIGGRYSFFGFGFAIGRNEKDTGQYEKSFPVDYVNGTAFMINKDFFWQLGGFDETFHYFYEDVDLALRAKKAGGECWYCPKSLIYHKGSLTFKQNSSVRIIRSFIRRNRLLTLIKNQTGLSLLIRLPGLLWIQFLLFLKEKFFENKIIKSGKKIAFVTPFYLPAALSGSGVVVKQLAENLTRKGYDCSIITSGALNSRWWYDPVFGKGIRKKFEVINDVKVYRLNCKQIVSFFSLILVRYFKPVLPRNLYHKLEILHCGPNLAGLPNLLSKERFTTLYSSPFPAYLNKQVADSVQKLTPRPGFILGPLFHAKLPDYHNPELKKILDKADLIHVATNSEEKDIKKIFKMPNSRFVCVPHFLNLSRTKNVTEIKKEVKKFKNKFRLNGKKIILFAAAKIYEKGAFTLLSAINNLHKTDPSYVLITIGNNTPAWNKRRKKMPADLLIDLGFVDEVQKEIAFAACDVFCMPSIAESFGLTYLEAWHKKKPVIGADIPSVKELIRSAKAGLLVEFDNEKNLTGAIEKLMTDQKLANKLGENGYQSLKQNYNFQSLFNKYQKLFDFS